MSNRPRDQFADLTPKATGSLDDAFADLSPQAAPNLDAMFGDLPTAEQAGQERLAAARAANPGALEVGAQAKPTLPLAPAFSFMAPLAASIGDAFQTAVGADDTLGLPLIQRLQDAGGIIGDAITPDALQRGVRRGQQGIALGLNLSGAAPESIYGEQSDISALGARLAGTQREIERYAAPPERQAALQRISDANGFGELIDAFTEAPGQAALATGDVILESTGVGLPSMTLAALGSAAGPGGTAVGAGAGSLATEFNQTILQKIQERGGDPTDPSVWQRALTDEAFMAEARKSGLERGIPIAAFDALSGGLAGRFIGPALGAGAGQVVRAGAQEAGMQAGAGMAGETLAQLFDEGKITSLGEIALEGVAELPGGVVEAGANVNAEAANQRAEADRFRQQALATAVQQLDPNKVLLQPGAQAASVSPAKPTVNAVAAPSVVDEPKREEPPPLTPIQTPAAGGNAGLPLPAEPPAAAPQRVHGPTFITGLMAALRGDEDASSLYQREPAWQAAKQAFDEGRIRNEQDLAAFVGAPAAAPAAATAPQPAPQPAGPPAPTQPVAAPAPPQGNRRTVTTAAGRKVDVEFQVVDASQLQAASGELQNRDRTRATSDLQIQSIAGNLDPERLGDSAEADRGAPIVGPDGIVESGNGRVAAIRKAYESVPERAEAYRQFLRSQGYNIEGMQQPVLIRRRVSDMTPEDRRAFVIEASTSATARLNAMEQAKSDADLVGDDVLGLYRGGELTTAGNRDFIRALVSRLPQSEQAAFYGPDGGLSQDGVRRVQNAMLARAYGDANLLSKLTEDQDTNIRSVGGALLDVAGLWAQLSGDVKAGRVKPEFDITKNVVEAAQRISTARDRGETVQQVLGQIDAFNPMDPVTERLIRAFYTPDLGRAIGREKIVEVLRAYAEQAQRQTTDAGLFGDLPPVTPVQILDAELAKRAPAQRASQGGLFGASGRPTQQAAPASASPAAAPQAPAAPAPEPQPATPAATGDVTLVEQGDGLFEIRAADGELIGNLILAETDDAITIRGIELEPGARGKGIGMAAYQQILDRATREGKTLASDSEVTTNAARIYDALERRGYAVTRNPEAKLSEDGKWRTPDESPVFTVAEKSEGPMDWAEIDALAKQTGGWAKAESVEDYDRVEAAGRRIIWRKARYPGDGKARLEIFDPERREIHDYGTDPAKAARAIDEDIAHYAKTDFELSMAFRTARREALGAPKSEVAKKPAAKKQVTRNGRPMRPDALEDTADNMSDADVDAERGRQNTRGSADPTTEQASNTQRRSWLEQAFVDLGIDKDRANLLPIGEQFKLVADLVKSKYGFSAILKAAGITERRAVDQVLDAYTNLQAMASVLGLPASAMSLDGKLTLVLAGKMKEYGLFAPEGYKIANIATSGPTVALRGRSNSFSHEWWHALDFDLASKVGGEERFGMLSTRSREAGLEDTDVETAFVKFMNAVFYDDASLANEVLRLEGIIKNGSPKKAEAAKADLEKLLSGRRTARVEPSEFRKTSGQFGQAVGDKKGYWTSAVEMTARAFEAYIGAKMAAAGGSNEFVNKGDAAYLSEADSRLAMTFPKAADRLRIFMALDDLFAVIAREQMIASGEAEAMPNYANRFDPRTFNSMAPTMLDKGLHNILKREIGEIRAQVNEWRKRTSRPKRPVSILSSARDLAMMGVSAIKAHARVLERRYPNSKSMRALFDLVVDAPGTTRKTDPMYRRMEMLFNRHNNRFSSIYERYNLSDPGRNEAVIGLMRGTVSPDSVSKDLVEAAGILRRFSDTLFDEQDRAGIKIGYSSNYISRKTDDPVVLDRPDDFVEAATKAYAAKFDREVSKNPEKLAEYAAAVNELRKGDQKIKPDDEGNFDADEVRDAWAPMRAQAYLYAIQFPSRGDRGGKVVKPAADHLLSREFGPEADEFLAPFYQNDLREIFTSYISAMSRRVAYAERFGPEGKKLEKLLDGMRAEGVPDSQVRMVKEMLPVAWGEPSFSEAWNSRTGQLVARGMNIIFTPAQIVLLARQILSQIPESVSVANTVGDRKPDLLTPGRTLLNATSSVWNTIKAIAGTADMRDFEAIVEYAGLLTRNADDHLVEARIGNAYDLDPNSIASKIRAAAYRNTGATGLTRKQRLGAMRVVADHLHFLAWQLKSDPKRARTAFQELTEAGVRQPVKMAEWLLQDDTYPTLEEMLNQDGSFNENAADYFRALDYLTNMAYQNPAPYDRAYATNNPVGAVVNAITSYTTSFYENQIKRTFKIAGQLMVDEAAAARDARSPEGIARAKGAAAAALYLSNSALAWSALFAGNLLFFTIRQYLTNREYMERLEDEDEEEKERSGEEGTKVAEHLLKGALGYTVSLGPLDRPKELLLQARYESDAKAILMGPTLSYYATQADRIMAPESARTKRTMTNTPEYIRAQGVYGAFLAPTFAVGLNLVPGGPLIRSGAGAGTMYLTSSGARDQFATAMVGERGARVPEKVAAREAERAQERTGRQTGRDSGGRETGRETGR